MRLIAMRLDDSAHEAWVEELRKARCARAEIMGPKNTMRKIKIWRLAEGRHEAAR